MQQSISIQYTNKVHIIKIQSFYYHLRTHQHIEPFLFKLLDQHIVRILIPDGVNIHPAYFNTWQFTIQYLFNFFRTKVSLVQFITTASLTGSNRRINIAAVMTLKFIRKFMIGERNIAVPALGDPSADRTHLVRRITSPVLKQNNLLMT